MRRRIPLLCLPAFRFPSDGSGCLICALHEIVLILRAGVQAIENLGGPIWLAVCPGHGDDFHAELPQQHGYGVDRLFAAAFDVDASFVEVEKHGQLLTNSRCDATNLLIDRFLVRGLKELVRPLQRRVGVLFFDGGEIAYVLPLIGNGPQSIPWKRGVSSKLCDVEAVAFVVQELGGNDRVGTRLLFRSRITSEFRSSSMPERMLFIQTGCAEGIDAERIDLDVPCDSRRCQLRSRDHYGAVFETRPEDLQRFFC